MKIIRKDVAFVQKNDIARLIHSNSLIPASVFENVFKNDTFVVVNDNRYDFVEFRNDDDIDFFRCIDWIVDYDELKDLTDDEIIGLGKKVADEQRQIAESYNALSVQEKRKKQNMVEKCELLEHKFYSIRDFLWFRQGHIKMDLPEEIEYPSQYVVNEEVVKEEKGIRKLIKTVFNRRKNNC